MSGPKPLLQWYQMVDYWKDLSEEDQKWLREFSNYWVGLPNTILDTLSKEQKLQYFRWKYAQRNDFMNAWCGEALGHIIEQCKLTLRDYGGIGSGDEEVFIDPTIDADPAVAVDVLLWIQGQDVKRRRQIVRRLKDLHKLFAAG